MNYLGIDPGLSGAVALIHEDGSAAVMDAPTIWVTKGKGRRRQYILQELFRLLGIFAEGGAVAALEEGIAMPRQSSTSTFSTGYGQGIYEMALVALRIPYERVRPQAWKKVMIAGAGVKDKKAAYLQAQRLFPDIELGSRSDHGRAEALLIAEFRRRMG